jgi:leucyl-tRNA synthetase
LVSLVFVNYFQLPNSTNTCFGRSEKLWKSLGKEGLAVKAPWPHVDAEDKLLTRQSAFLSNAMKSFRGQVGKAKKGWKDATILICDSYPDWKVKTLQWLQGQHDGHAFSASFMQDLKTWTSENVTDKKLVKFTMQFASFIKKEVEEVGTVAMDTELPFDQKAILESSVLYIQAQLNLSALEFIRLGDSDASKIVPDRVAENVSPGKPFLWLQ